MGKKEENDINRKIKNKRNERKAKERKDIKNIPGYYQALVQNLT